MFREREREREIHLFLTYPTFSAIANTWTAVCAGLTRYSLRPQGKCQAANYIRVIYLQKLVNWRIWASCLVNKNWFCLMQITDNNQPAHSPFLASIFKSILLLMLCTVRTVWSDAVIRPACLNVLPRWWPNKYKSRMIYWQTAYASVVLMEVTGVIRGLPTDDDKWNPYDSVVLTKDTGVKQKFADRWWPMKSWKKKLTNCIDNN